MANRQEEQAGIEMLINCALPGIDQSLSTISSPLRGFSFDGIVKRQEECTSPEGSGPRDAPAIPPPVSEFEMCRCHCDGWLYFLTVCRLKDSRECWIETLMQITGS